MWPFMKRNTRTNCRLEPSVIFVGEQDGPPEQDLKMELRQLLSAYYSIERAYLARAHYGDPASQFVVLCLAGPDDPALVDRVGRIISRMFTKEVFLDIMFVEGAGEQPVAAVCNPFYGNPVITEVAEGRFLSRPVHLRKGPTS